MNIYTKDISALLNITMEEALKVQDQMEINGIDFSEVSTRIFNREALMAAQEIGVEKKKWNLTEVSAPSKPVKITVALTTDQMIDIIENKKINQCSPEHKAQVMEFAFGKDFIESDCKGDIKNY